jgi:hypothetical protein
MEIMTMIKLFILMIMIAMQVHWILMLCHSDLSWPALM